MMTCNKLAKNQNNKSHSDDGGANRDGRKRNKTKQLYNVHDDIQKTVENIFEYTMRREVFLRKNPINIYLL